MARRSRHLQLDADEVGEAIADYVKRHHPEMWSPGTLEVVIWKDSAYALTLTWRLGDGENGRT